MVLRCSCREAKAFLHAAIVRGWTCIDMDQVAPSGWAAHLIVNVGFAPAISRAGRMCGSRFPRQDPIQRIISEYLRARIVSVIRDSRHVGRVAGPL